VAVNEDTAIRREGVLKILRKAVVETGRDERLVGSGVVGTTVVGDRAGFAADGEIHGKCPHEYPDVDVTIPFNDPALACAVVKQEV